MAESPGLGVVHCLEQLSDAVFLKFKELLRKKPQLQAKLNSWTNTETTSRKDLITLLNTHYPGQVWDIMSSTFLQVNRRDLWTMAQELRRGKRARREKGHMGSHGSRSCFYFLVYSSLLQYIPSLHSPQSSPPPVLPDPLLLCFPSEKNQVSRGHQPNTE